RSDNEFVSDHAIVITKNTSDARLQEIKSELAAKGVSFSYKKVRRNSQGEITRIKIETNNGKGSKSTISAMADDGEPIDDIVIEL
ncbi:MAG: hypothetical protein AAFP76_06785, partial [Bacteroidota bacterium]